MGRMDAVGERFVDDRLRMPDPVGPTGGNPYPK
jgi:hypothetical protein